MTETSYREIAVSAVRAVADYFSVSVADLCNLCEAEKSFAHPLGYGGKVDLHSHELNFVLDFKTKEFSDVKKFSYDEHRMQLAAYAHGLGMPHARLINVFVSTTVPGLVSIEEHKDNGKYFRQFMATFDYWKSLKGFSLV